MRPNIHLQTESVTIWHGDSIDTMRELPDNSIDSIVTDPPYGLGFMGKAWDALPPGEEWAAECLRVLKPGGHLLAFGGSRTWHRLAVAVEDAGFEIRDSIAWLYGSGFPKSLDVSKSIDKARTEDLEPIRAVCRAIRAAMDARGLKSKDLTEHFDGCHSRLIDHWAARDTDSQPALPKWGQWEKLRDLLDLGNEHDAEVWRLNSRKGTHGEAWQSAEVVGTARGIDTSASRLGFAGETYGGTGASKEYDLKAPATPEAERWQGWGTALKPAFEPVVVGRKPLIGTVAQNVQKYGVGALNIDATRIEGGQIASAGGTRRSGGIMGESEPLGGWEPKHAGRWPANVVLDDTTAAGFEESRFFYVAKAPKRERPVVDGVAHPTVKPLALMRWLVKLVTPPGGVVLDPFEGSGTTLEACLLEGFNHVGIEREQDYLPLIEARLDRQAGTLPTAA